MRAERENCCDDVVIAARGNAREYAAALATLEQLRWGAGEAAAAATGGNLVKRIRRLLYPNSPKHALTPLLSAIILAISGAVAVFAWQTDQLPRAPSDPQAGIAATSPWMKWLNEDVVYIITDAERAACLKLTTDRARANFIEQFWLRRDPTPGIPENKMKDEHYRRISYANLHESDKTLREQRRRGGAPLMSALQPGPRAAYTNFVIPGIGMARGVKLPFHSIVSGPSFSWEFSACSHVICCPV
jgi:hypothetical protein